jgi:peptidoglycan hydrolase CwlO-like protein
MKKSLIAVSLIGTLLFTPVGVFGASTQQALSQAQQQADASQSQLSTVQQTIADLESKKNEAEAYLTSLSSQVNEINTQIAALEQDYTQKQTELDQVELELQKAQQDEEEQRDAMELRIRYMYEQSEGNGMLEQLLSSGSIAEFLNRADNFKSMTAYDRKQLSAYVKTCDEVEEKENQVAAEQKQIDSLRTQTEDKRNELQSLLSQTQAQVQSFAASIADQQSQQATLIATIEEQQRVIGELTRKAADEVAQAEAAARAAAGNAGANATVPSDANAQQQNSDPALSYIGGNVLTKQKGVVMGPSGKETYYNMNMSGVVRIMRNMGNTDPYWVRSDGVKMLGDYVMVAANLRVHPRGSLVNCSLGKAIVCDTGTFALTNPTQLDIAVTW